MDKQLTAAELAAYGTLLVSIGALLTKLIDHFVQSYVKVRQRTMEDKFEISKIDLLEDKQLQDALKWVAKKQDRQITNLQSRCDQLQSQHSKCMEELARSEALRESIQITLQEAKNKVEEYRVELRLIQGQRYPSPQPKPPPSDNK